MRNHARPGLAFAALAGAVAATPPGLLAADVREEARPIFSEALPNAPGKRLSAVVVAYPPAGASLRHHHSGSVFAFVLSGAVRSENSATGPGRVYQAGEAFFEPPGSEHMISENASATARRASK